MSFHPAGDALDSPPNDEAERFQILTDALMDPAHQGFRLAELADYLCALPPERFRRAVAERPRAALDHATLNYLAGAIELAAERRGQMPPAWTAAVPPGETPAFGSELASVRLYLLTQAPVAFRRRTIFVDASFDKRV